MATQAGNSAGLHSPQVVGNAFAQQYYRVLCGSPDHVHKFYHDKSILGRPDADGTMTYVTTTHAINEQFLSTDLKDSLIELEDVDTQPSHMGGVLILVTGSLTMPDTVKHKFTQAFFLAPQENGGYFVLNDVLRYVPDKQSVVTNEALANHVNGSTQIAPFPAEPETMSIKENMDPELPSAERIFVNSEVINSSPETISVNAKVINPSAENISVNDKVMSPSAENISVNDKVMSPSAENISVKEKVIKVVSVAAEKIPEAAPAPPASAQKDAIKKSYASIVKVMKESTQPTPITMPKPKPNPTVKRAENVEKSAPIPAKIIHAADTASPNDKNVSNVQGYSVFVKNLPFNATIEMVEAEFRKFGAIKPHGIQVRNRQPDRFCFGFVEFESQQSMYAAIEASPIRFGLKESYVEEKRTTTRVVNGVTTHGDNNGNARGSRIQPGRGGYHGNNVRLQGPNFVDNGNYRDGENFSGQGLGFMNNGNYLDGNNRRNESRNQNEYSGRGRGPQGNGYHQNEDGYHQNEDGYHQNGNGYHHNGNGYLQNGHAYRQDGDRYHQHGDGYRQDRDGYRQNGDGYRQNGDGYRQDGHSYGQNGDDYRQNRDVYRQNGDGYHQNGDGYRQNRDGYRQNGDGYRQPRPVHDGSGNGRSARFNGPKQPPVIA